VVGRAPQLLEVLPAVFSLDGRDSEQRGAVQRQVGPALTAVKPVAHMLSPVLTFALLCGYAIVALAAGAWALARRDV
jgi:hypothetical protein